MQSGSSTTTRTSKPPTSKTWTSNGRRSCPSSPGTTTETAPEQEETESPLTDSNRRPPPYHGGVSGLDKRDEHPRNNGGMRKTAARTFLVIMAAPQHLYPLGTPEPWRRLADVLRESLVPTTETMSRCPVRTT